MCIYDSKQAVILIAAKIQKKLWEKGTSISTGFEKKGNQQARKESLVWYSDLRCKMLTQIQVHPQPQKLTRWFQVRKSHLNLTFVSG